jgi:predicted nucleic acid-binding protein
MRITVTDTNVFIDILYFDWVQYLFALELEIYTTEYVLLELHEPQRLKLEALAANGQLIVHKLGASELAEIEAVEMPKGFSQTDKSVVWLAQKIQALVLTGDAPVRKFCEKAGLEVHGIIWVFDMLVERKIMKHSEAAGCLEKLLAYNKRLPFDECERRVENWKK